MSSLAERVPALHPKMLAATLRDQAKADPKPLGIAIERALVLANITKQDVSHRMGYTDQSSISKWISGKEPPRFDKLWAIRELRPHLVIALAESEDRCEVNTTVRVRIL